MPPVHHTKRPSTIAALPSLPASWLARYRRLLTAMLVIGPLLIFPAGLPIYDPHEAPRRLLYLCCAGVLLAGMLFGWARRKSCVYRAHPLDRPVWLFAGALLLASLTAAYPFAAWREPIWEQANSALLLWCGLALYWGVKEFLREEQEIAHAARAMVYTAGAVAAIGLLDHYLHLGLNPDPTNARLAATFSNSMFAGTYFAMTLPLGLCLALRETRPRPRLLLLACTALLLPALLLTQARAAWVGGAATLLLLLPLLALGRTVEAATRRALAIGAVVLLAACALALADPAVRQRVTSLTNPHDGTVQTRLVYMSTAWQMFLHRPLTGWGPGNLLYVFPQYRPAADLTEYGGPVNRMLGLASLPHDWPCQYAAELGILGLAAFLYLLVTLYRTVVPHCRHSWLARGLLGMVTAALITNLFAYDNAATLVCCWVGLGMLAALGAREQPCAPGAAASARLAALPWHAAGTLLATLVVLATLQSLLVASLLQTGISAYTLGQTEKSPARLKTLNTEAIDALQEARLCAFGADYLVEQQLFYAYQQRMTLPAPAEQLAAAHDQAIATARHLLRYFDRPTSVLGKLGLLYLDDGNLPEARRCLAPVVADEPTNANAHYLYALLLGREGKMPEASEELQRATRLDPTYAEYHFLYALALAGARHMPEAMEQARQAVHLDGGSEKYRMALARLQQMHLAQPR